MNTETRLSKCHEDWVPEWVPEFGTKAWRQMRAEAWEAFECRPGAVDEGVRPVQGLRPLDARAKYPSTKRVARLHIVEIIKERLKDGQNIGRVHLEGSQCPTAKRPKRKGRGISTIVVGAREFVDVLEWRHDVCCGHCLLKFDGTGIRGKLRP